MYWFMVLFVLSVFVIVLIYRGNKYWGRVLIGLVMVIGFYVGVSLLIGDFKQCIVESFMSMWMVDVFLCVSVFLLVI